MNDANRQRGSAPTDAPPLDDVMLAMDVVDTLRRRERLVARELNEAGREEDIKQRLRTIYAQQGIDVPDRILDEGVTALKQDRFTYRPPPASLATRLALVWVTRGRWGKWALGVAAAIFAAVAWWYFAVVAPDAALADDLVEKHEQVAGIAATAHARETAERILNAGNAALRNENHDAAREAGARLDALRRILEQDYTIRIVNRPDERSGVWRVPDVNTGARNYYIIVEALDPSGQSVEVPVEDEETGKTEWVRRWGQRVDAATFEAVARDKQDNGIIENNRFGSKRVGHLAPEFEIPTPGGAITKW